MAFRIKVILLFCLVTVLSGVLCWKIYHSSNDIRHAFDVFTDEDLQTLDHLFAVRANMGEYERLLYEYYATTEREPLLTRLTIAGQALDKDFAFLRGAFKTNENFQILQNSYAGLSEEFRQMVIIIENSSTDWDVARESLVKLSEHGREAIPAMNQLFHEVSLSSDNSKSHVKDKLEDITILVLGFVIATLSIFIAVGYFTRETLLAEKALRKAEMGRQQVEALTIDLTAARDEAERANATKSDFLSHVSHELRTPLNAILGFGQLLALDAEGFNETQQENVQDILIAGNHLLILINDILDLAKIESGKIDISMEEVHVDGLMQQCIALINPLAEARQLELIDHISNKGYTVQADFTRLKQVLLNLLSNAVKYNREQGRITLDSEIVDKQRLRVRVTDTGEGLTESDIAKLFTPFERLKAANHVEGTGIGLVITKHLIELMGGNIGIESTPGEGSTFWVELALTSNTFAMHIK